MPSIFTQKLLTVNKMILRYQVNLATQTVAVGSTSDTLGLVVVSNLFAAVPGAEIIRVISGTLTATNALSALGGSVTALNVYTQDGNINSGNNQTLRVPATAATPTLAVSGGAVAAGTSSTVIAVPTAGLALPTGRENLFVLNSGSSQEVPKIILAAAGAATAAASIGVVEIAIEIEVSMANSLG